jgi:hypothetical protein
VYAAPPPYAYAGPGWRGGWAQQHHCRHFLSNALIAEVTSRRIDMLQKHPAVKRSKRGIMGAKLDRVLGNAEVLWACAEDRCAARANKSPAWRAGQLVPDKSGLVRAEPLDWHRIQSLGSRHSAGFGQCRLLTRNGHREGRWQRATARAVRKRSTPPPYIPETLPTAAEVTSIAPSATPTRTSVRIHRRYRI